jgi:hypothetical protein
LKIYSIHLPRRYIYALSANDGCFTISYALIIINIYSMFEKIMVVVEEEEGKSEL